MKIFYFTVRNKCVLGEVFLFHILRSFIFDWCEMVGVRCKKRERLMLDFRCLMLDRVVAGMAFSRM
jgi:hypothetical protein